MPQKIEHNPESIAVLHDTMLRTKHGIYRVGGNHHPLFGSDVAKKLGILKVDYSRMHKLEPCAVRAVRPAASLIVNDRRRR